MNRWLKRAAVVAAWLGLCVAGRAQVGLPSPVGAARLPDPLRYCPEPQPNLVPGPLTPAMAPAGPPESLNLPANHSSAFQLEHFTPESRCYGSLGGVVLKPYRLANLPVTFRDTQSAGLDTGVVPVGPLPVLERLSRLDPQFSGGPSVTVGYLNVDHAIELSGYYVFARQTSRKDYFPGQQYVPFTAPGGGFPIGFEGNNGLFLQSDLVRVAYQNQLGNVELNYRRWNSGINGVDWIFGVRYLHASERINIFTDDEFFTKDLFGRSDPRRQATYSAYANNNIIALQFGGEYSAPMPHKALEWLWFTGIGKAGVGPNIVERRQALSRGDGLSAFDIGRYSTGVAGVFELGGFLDFHVLEKCRLRFGYQAVWAVGVSTAANQIEFNLAAQGGKHRDSSSIMWHGPMAEIQFLF